jgi:hypothetical protein
MKKQKSHQNKSLYIMYFSIQIQKHNNSKMQIHKYTKIQYIIHRLKIGKIPKYKTNIQINTKIQK